MKRQYSIFFKAFFLLTVFSLNTVVSFACSTSDLFHNSHHSNKSRSTTTHQHEDKPHAHHKHGQHSHDLENNQSNNDDDNCCSSYIITLAKIEKSIARNIEFPATVITSYYAEFAYLLLANHGKEKTFFPDFIRWRPPATIQDLRIVIQSFQI